MDSTRPTTDILSILSDDIIQCILLEWLKILKYIPLLDIALCSRLLRLRYVGFCKQPLQNHCLVINNEKQLQSFLLYQSFRNIFVSNLFLQVCVMSFAIIRKHSCIDRWGSWRRYRITWSIVSSMPWRFQSLLHQPIDFLFMHKTILNSWLVHALFLRAIINACPNLVELFADKVGIMNYDSCIIYRKVVLDSFPSVMNFIPNILGTSYQLTF